MARIFTGIVAPRFLWATIVMVCAVPGSAAAQSGGTYVIEASVIGGGGTASTVGENVSLSVTIGEPNVGLVAGGSYAVDGGLLSTPLAPPNPCVGDCSGDGQVTVDELVTMINIALGESAVASCGAGDANGDGQITVDEILTAVSNTLNGCGNP